MESVTPVLYFNHNWADTMRKFWDVLLRMFKVKKNLTAGTHVHVGKGARSRFTLKEAKAIAFASCYYEPYVISLLPVERRDYRYCRRNTKVAGRMGQLYRKRSESAISQIASDIKRKTNRKGLCTYVQGGMDAGHRSVLWNFQNLMNKKGTIEFRGGRHMRGPRITLRWITFVIVFVLMALEENLLYSRQHYRVPHNSTAAEVQQFWEKFRRYADKYGVKRYLPAYFKAMSHKRRPRSNR